MNAEEYKEHRRKIIEEKESVGLRPIGFTDDEDVDVKRYLEARKRNKFLAVENQKMDAPELIAMNEKAKEVVTLLVVSLKEETEEVAKAALVPKIEELKEAVKRVEELKE